MRAKDFITDTERVETGHNKTPSPKKADKSARQRSPARERTLADIKRDFDSDKSHNDKRSMGEILADIQRRHRTTTKQFDNDK